MTLMAPLVPSELDLNDFGFMPIDVRRLLTSETWVLGTGDEKAAAMTLWLESWHQVPAGSLPSDDRMLEHLAQSKRWKAVKAHVMRGWVACTDGRLYHPVVCEKALEAWIEKLANSISGAAGNAKRWGIDFDAAPIRDQFRTAVAMLRALAPQSKALKKKVVAIITAGSPPEGQHPPATEGNTSSTDTNEIAPRSKTHRPPMPNKSPPDGESVAPRIAPESPPDRKGQGQGQGQGQGYGTTASPSASLPCLPETPAFASLSPPSPNPHPNPNPTAAGVAKNPRPPPATAGRTVAAWTAYASAYAARYGVEPPRNRTVNAHLASLIDRLGADAAPGVAAHYLASSRGLYVAAKHPTTLLLRDAEALHTEWRTGTHGTETQARQADRTQATGNVFGKLIADAERDGTHG